MEIRSLQTEGFRLSAIYILIFALSVLAIGAAVIMIADRALREQILQSARTDILALQRAYDQEGVEEVREVIGQLKGAPDASELFLVQQGGRRIAGNLEAMPARTGVLELAVGVRHAAVLGVGANIAPGLYVFSGSRLARVEQVDARILHTLLWLFLVALLLAVLGGIFISRSFLGRTDAMARACRIIMDGELKARLPIRGSGDELDRLAAAVNEMLDRIALLMLNLGQVTNDIAHDIRTPLTHLRQRLESGKRDSTTVAEYDAALDAAIEKADEILGLCAALLRIVQIEAGSRSTAFTTLSLAKLLAQVHDMYAPVAEGAGHTLISVADEGDALLAGDRALLVQMLANLIENAIIHTPDGTHIWLRLTRPEPGKVAVTVADDGPGVPPEEYAKLFQRLYRREASRTTPGYGLGLSLVAAIAELHGAKVEIEPVERGLSVRITFNTCVAQHPERAATVPVHAAV